MTAKGDYRVGMGASSVLMILVVLAMTALGLLSLGSARQTEAQTKRNLQTTQAYYEAAEAAQRTLAQMDALLLESRQSGKMIDAEALRALGVELGAGADGAQTFEFIKQAGDKHELVVRGAIGGAQGARYTLTQHALVSTYVAEERTLELIGE